MTSKIRTMSLYPHNMEKMLSGQKTVEIRVEYPNYKDLAAGQLIRFLSGEDSCLTRIVRITRYASFDDMLDTENPRTIGYEEHLSKAHMLERIRKIYPPAKEALGVLAIEFTREPPDDIEPV